MQVGNRDLGIIFGRKGADHLAVVAFGKLGSGKTGPAHHEGGSLSIRDVVIQAQDGKGGREIPLAIDQQGFLQLPLQFAGPLFLTFKRPVVNICRDNAQEEVAVVLPAGGRPAARKPKYPRAHVGAEGGTKKRMNTKRDNPHPLDPEHVERMRIRQVALSQETQDVQRDEAHRTVMDEATVYLK